MIPLPGANCTGLRCTSIGTARMDGSVNDRATKRQRGEVDNDSNHTSSTASESSGSMDASLSQSQSSATAMVAPQVPEQLKSVLAKKYRRVTFAPVTEIRSTHWNPQEIEGCWYTKDELAVFKQERKELVKQLKRVQFDLSKIDTSVHCLRGYEAYLSIQANKEYKLKRQMALKAVLQEQARQRHQLGGRVDAMMMQLVSSHTSQWARDTAWELGTQDAQAALEIFLEYMREQQEDIEEEEYHDCDEFDDDPIAVNWNEPWDETESIDCEPIEWNTQLLQNDDSDQLDPLQLSSSSAHKQSSSAARLGSSHHSRDSYFVRERCHPPNGLRGDSLGCLPALQPFPSSNQNNKTNNIAFCRNA